MFSPSVTEVTVSETIYATAPLVIRGNGRDATDVRFDPTSPSEHWALLDIEEASLQLEAISLTGVGEGLVGVTMYAEQPSLGASAITDSLIRGFGSAGLATWGMSGSFTVTSSEFTDNGSGLDLFNMSESPLTVVDSIFAENKYVAINVSQYTPGQGDGMRIERTLFENNGATGDDDWPSPSGALGIAGDLSEGIPGEPPVRIVDSTFVGNTGSDVGAIGYQPQWGGVASNTPRILVSGSTFVGNIGGPVEAGYEAKASAILAYSMPMKSNSDDGEADLELAIRIENSTFDGSAAAAAGMSTALLGGAHGGARFEIDQVTAVSSSVEFLGWREKNEVAITRSAIDSAGIDPLPPRSDSELDPHDFDITDSVFTHPSESQDLTQNTLQLLPLAALELGPLADNGGPTQTMLPSETSPLVDAVTEAGTLTVDQRGFPRPVNGAADIGAVEVEMREQPVLESTVSILADVKVANGETAVFTAERTAPTPARADAEALPAVTVTIATSDGTAIAGTDYTASELTLSWAEGESGAKPFAVPTAKLEGPQQEREFSVTLSEPSEHLTIDRATATGTLPAIEGSAVVPEVTPPGKGDKGDIAETGGSGPIGWMIAAALAVLAGAGVLTARRALRQ